MSYTVTELVDSQIKVEMMNVEENVNRQFIPDVAIAEAVLKEQQANVDILESKTKDLTAQVSWLEHCSTTVEDEDDECDFTGMAGSSRVEDYTIGREKMRKFKIEEERWRTNTYTKEEVLAKELMLAMKDLDEEIAVYITTQLGTFSGNNKYTNANDIGSVVGDTTYISSTDFGTELIYAYLARVAAQNKMRDSFLLDGGNLYKYHWNAEFNRLDDDKRSQWEKAGFKRTYFDIFNIDSTLGAPTTMMVSPYAYAFASKARYDSIPVEGPNDTKRFSIPSKSLPGVVYDVLVRSVCVRGGHDWVDHFKLVARYDFFQSPIGQCDADLTGILKFESGAAPSGSGSAS